MTKKLILFDIDHTLMDVKDSHKKVFANAFNEVLGLHVDYTIWKFHGYTDLQIIYEILDSNGIERNEEEIAKIIEVMIRDFKEENLDHAVLMEGVDALLKELSNDENVILGIVTGNVEEIAYTKLRHFKIDESFILGGFGHSSEVRGNLVKIAIEEAESKFGKIDKNDVFIIGDTIHDITAAKDNGVKAIAVATGTHDYNSLKTMNPSYLFHDLKDTKKIIDVIKNG